MNAPFGKIFDEWGVEPDWEVVRCIRGQAEADALREQWNSAHPKCPLCSSRLCDCWKP